MTHMWRRPGIPQNSFWHSFRNLKNKYLKNLLKWVNKKQDNCDIYYVAFKKMKKNTCGYHYQNLNNMIYSSWVTEQNRMKLVVLGQFLPFYPFKSPKYQNFEKMKFTHVPKITIIWFETNRIVFHFASFFALLPH